MDFNEVFEFVVQNCIATEDEIRLVCDICGHSVEMLNEIIWNKTGYHDVEDIHESEPDNYCFDMVTFEEG